MKTYAQVLKEAARRLVPVAGEEAEREAMLLLCHISGRSHLGTLRTEPFPEQYCGKLAELIHAREEGEPLQYLLGEWEFMGLPFLTEPCALIPRQDTETLVECALSYAQPNQKALDLCCGTGCIGISLAKLGQLQVDLADISPQCIALAQKNAEKNGVLVQLRQSDLFKNIKGSYHIICCNPPYIPTREWGSLQREVKKEPRLALDGGEDGLDFYRRIRDEAGNHLLPGGRLFLEVGQGQAPIVAALFGGGEIKKDLCGVERVVIIHKGFSVC